MLGVGSDPLGRKLKGHRHRFWELLKGGPKGIGWQFKITE